MNFRIPKRITTENSTFQTFLALKNNRKKRFQGKKFFVEGVRSIKQSIKFGWKIDSFIYSSDLPISQWAQSTIDQTPCNHVFNLSLDLMKKLSDKEEQSELMVVVEMPEDDLSRVKWTPQSIIVLCDRPSSPGNLGSIIRSADALGASGVFVFGHAADIYDPVTIRAATGSFFSIPVVRIFENEALVSLLRERRKEFPLMEIVSSSENASTDVSSHTFSFPVFLLMGNETRGLSTFMAELSDVELRIPMVGSASSLNVSCASSIFLYEIFRQARFHQ